MVETPRTPRVESVWDYPRPPAVEPSGRRVRVVVEGVTIVDSRRAQRVLETSHPPAWYVPREDVRMDLLTPTSRSTACEFKGEASYFDVDVSGVRATPRGPRRDAAWTYESPRPGYESIAGAIAFYPGKVDEAWIDDERVLPQPGDFYGGWITSEVTGPFKGGPGTGSW